MQAVNATIITIGDELLIGQTIDTNSAFIAQELNKIGIWVKRRTAIGDLAEEILKSLEETSREAQLVIITGGLGPTADDITKPTLCRFFDSRLVVNESVLQHVKNIFLRLNRPMAGRNLKQAEVPHNCTVLHNSRGTAPGMWFEKDGVIYVSLPGVPLEMKGLMMDEVIPRLQQSPQLPAIVHRTLVTSGVGESSLADTIQSFEESLPPHIKLAYLPSYGMVRLRLTCRSENAEQAQSEVNAYIEQLRPLVQPWLMAESDIPLEAAAVELLKGKAKTLATAESCTGGFVAHLLTSIAGSSAVFKGSVVAYDNEVKEGLLGVKKETLAEHGAVSEATVREMAAGVLQAIHADYAIATSGIMGPGGGSEEKPVGTVWVALASRREVQAFQLRFPYDRMRNIHLTANTVLTRLIHFVRQQEGDGAD